MKYFKSLTTLLSAVCLSSASYAQLPDKTNDPTHWLYVGHVNYNGNALVIESPINDTIPAENPETGEIWYKIIPYQKVTKLNGKDVYSSSDNVIPANTGKRGWDRTIEKLIRKELRQSWNYFEEARIVVDEKGKLAYVDVKFWPKRSPDDDRQMKEKKKLAITRSITEKLSALQFTPAQKDGQAVPYYLVFQ